MKYIITESQYNLINEALGVPESILEAAEEVYGMILNDLKSITQKEDEYEFYGDIDITLGYKQKIYLDSYKLIVEINEIDEFQKYHNLNMYNGLEDLIRKTPGFWYKLVKPLLDNKFYALYEYTSSNYIVMIENNINTLVDRYKLTV